MFSVVTVIIFNLNLNYIQFVFIKLKYSCNLQKYIKEINCYEILEPYVFYIVENRYGLYGCILNA